MLELIAETVNELTLPELEAAMLEEPQASCPVIHRFSPGVYIREVHIPAGAVAIGHYQKTRHLNIFLQGRVTMFNDDGTRTDLEAPMIFTGEPGRKAGYVHEDIVWLNVYPTEETDIETLESMYLDKSEAFLSHLPELDRTEDQQDYFELARDFGEDVIQRQTHNESDQIPMPEGAYKFLISKSGIDGKGVFASAEVNEGEIIGPARLNGMRTPLGRYTNHAKAPNARMERIGQDIFLVAIRGIQGCHGGLNGEEITTNYRETLNLIGATSCQA